MASYKNVQNSVPRDLKLKDCTINLPLVFTILVYMISGDPLKVFFVTKFRVFYIYVSQKIVLTYICRGVFGPGKEVGFIVLLLEIETKYFNTI